jgi:hypothetical protein
MLTRQDNLTAVILLSLIKILSYANNMLTFSQYMAISHIKFYPISDLIEQSHTLYQFKDNISPITLGIKLINNLWYVKNEIMKSILTLSMTRDD